MGRPGSARQAAQPGRDRADPAAIPGELGKRRAEPATGPSSLVPPRTGGPEALRRVEWRQLLPNEQQRRARQLKLMIRYEGKIC